MFFVAPARMKHLPNDEQIKLLAALTYKNKCPGFIHESALVLHGINMTYATQVQVIKNCLDTINLFIPFETHMTYIMSSLYDVVGTITYPMRMVHWFRDPITLGEIETAQKHEIPILTSYNYLGQAEKCLVCNGNGAVDWVDHIKLSKEFKEVPQYRYMITNHRQFYFLTDNKWIYDYDGDDIIYPCPKCFGSGINSVLYVDKTYERESIQGLKFDENPMGYHLLIRDMRNKLIEPYPQSRYDSWK